MDKNLENKIKYFIDKFSETHFPVVPNILDNFCYRWTRNHVGVGSLQPLENWQSPKLKELIGLDAEIKEVTQNTQSFVDNKPGNHTLITGPRGCGKTTVMYGVLGEFETQDLKIIKVDRDHLVDLPQIADQIAKLEYHFVVVCDELSFSSTADGYLEIKTALDELDRLANNILVYATSNRRHMISETTEENEEAHLDKSGELHPGETTEEKISFSDRFGLWIPVGSPDQDEYKKQVKKWVCHYTDPPHNFKFSYDPETEKLAMQWARERGSFNGRIAHQFVRDLIAQGDK